MTANEGAIVYVNQHSLPLVIEGLLVSNNTAMADLLIYVNDIVFCSVIFENTNVTLDKFRHDVLTEQVGDILNFDYKFTRLVRKEKVTIGIKQEAVVRLSQCIDGAEEPALFLVSEKKDDVVEVPNLKIDTEKAQEVSEPPVKVAKISRQPTITEFSSVPSSKTPRQPYSAARARKVKLYSDREIQGASGMVKLYRAFWNNKAEEICSSQALKQFTQGEVQGAINVAWIIEKATHIKNEAKELEIDVGPGCPDHMVKKFTESKKTLERNTKRMEAAKNSLTQIQGKLDNARHELFNSKNKVERTEALTKIENVEKDLEKELTELRKAEDSLRKSVDNKRKLLSAQSQLPSDDRRPEGDYDTRPEGDYDTDHYDSEPGESDSNELANN